MCDCYNHSCCIAGCENGIPFHIADFDYPRSDFTVWCEDHVALAPPEAVQFEWLHDEDDWGDPDRFEWLRCAVLGPEVDEYTNTLNAECRIVSPEVGS